MKIVSNLLILVIIICGLRVTAHASLIDRGGGLIYDTDLNITWLQDANYAKTSGYDADGRMDWGDAMNWVSNLSYYDSVHHVTWNDWRLPSALNQDDTGPCLGFYCYDSEMGHLYNIELENNSGHLLHNVGPFINLIPYTYWSSTEDISNSYFAWDFGFFDGDQLHSNKDNDYLFAWAVRDGDVASIPEPTTFLLIGSGLLGFVFFGMKRFGQLQG